MCVYSIYIISYYLGWGFCYKIHMKYFFMYSTINLFISIKFSLSVFFTNPKKVEGFFLLFNKVFIFYSGNFPYVSSFLTKSHEDN